MFPNHNTKKELELLAKDLMEPDTDKIHNEEIRKAFMEINKNGGGDMGKPFYTQFEKLRNEIKDKDKIIQDKDKIIQDKDKIIQDKDKIIQDKYEVIQRKREELLILQEQINKANKALEENNLVRS